MAVVDGERCFAPGEELTDVGIRRARQVPAVEHFSKIDGVGAERNGQPVRT